MIIDANALVASPESLLGYQTRVNSTGLAYRTVKIQPPHQQAVVPTRVRPNDQSANKGAQPR